MFFIQKRYSEEVEKNNKHKNKEPSIARMTFLGLMATFTPTRWLLRMHKRKVE
ncbi:MAG: alpha/beta hydrolase, partial [Lactobacillus gasseri]|nr:alpha/beta hydrolase [Lactobacillus gasseri]